jgi:starch-binding outer membrane protein, SusD/RagB family
MKKHNISLKITVIILLGVLSAGWYSCSDLLDAKEGDVLTDDEIYKTTYDADVAILGVYSKLMGLSERIVVLNELRADLLDVTNNATADMTKLNNHTEDSKNTFCSPTPFYEVILNCNEALEKFTEMKAANILDEKGFTERYGDIMAVRCWTYLQLGIQFGSVPYVTKAINTKKEAFDSKLFPVKSLDELLPLLIADMNSLSSLDDYLNVELPSNIETGYSVALGFINKRILLGDLYLWNNEYENAAWQYYNFLSKADDDNYKYKTTSGTWQTGSVPQGFWVNFLRYNSGNVNAYGNTWKNIFSLGTTDEILQDEMIWALSYDYRYNPAYPFIKLFANTGQGKYMLKPSAYAIDSLWENQVQRENGFAYDGRGREASFDWVNGDPVVLKYSYDYYTHTTDANGTIHLDYNTPVDAYKQDGRWFIYRSALVQLHYAEAVNRAGYPKLAMALVNRGIRSAFTLGIPSDIISLTTDTGVVRDTIFYPAPYSLDARSDDDYTGPWYNNAGLRGRVFLNGRSRPSWANEHAQDTVYQNTDPTGFNQRLRKDSVLWVEEYILDEAALELGFEGHRWGDLLRVTRRRTKDDAGNRSNLLQKQVAAKFAIKGMNSPNLETESSWYLPFSF